MYANIKILFLSYFIQEGIFCNKNIKKGKYVIQ